MRLCSHCWPHCKKRLPDSKLIAVLFSWHKHSYLEGSFTGTIMRIWQKNTTAVPFLLGSVISFTTVFLFYFVLFWRCLSNQMWIPSCGAGLKFNEKIFGYICNRLAIWHQWAPLSWWGQQCSIQGPQMNNTADCNSPPAVWTVFSNNIKPSQKGGSCQPSSSLISLCPVAKACAILAIGSYHFVLVWIWQEFK